MVRGHSSAVCPELALTGRPSAYMLCCPPCTPSLHPLALQIRCRCVQQANQHAAVGQACWWLGKCTDHQLGAAINHTWCAGRCTCFFMHTCSTDLHSHKHALQGPHTCHVSMVWLSSRKERRTSNVTYQEGARVLSMCVVLCPVVCAACPARLFVLRRWRHRLVRWRWPPSVNLLSSHWSSSSWWRRLARGLRGTQRHAGLRPKGGVGVRPVQAGCRARQAVSHGRASVWLVHIWQRRQPSV